MHRNIRRQPVARRRHARHSPVHGSVADLRASTARLALACSVVVAALPIAAAQAQTQAQTQNPTQNATQTQKPTAGQGQPPGALPALAPVVVTATKHEQPLFETPASVTLVDGQAVEDAGLQTLTDVVLDAPNVYFSDFTGSSPTVTIRGLGFSDDESDTQSIGILVDGVPMFSNSLGTLFDLERVEVLRGPQSTLYGQNSMGGLIAIRTRDPGLTFGGGLQFDYGTGNRRRLAGAVDLPLGERTAIRLALGAENADGYVDNTALGRDDTANWRSRFARLKLIHTDGAGGQWRIGLHHASRNGGNDFFVTPAQARAHQSGAGDAGRNDSDYSLLTGEYERPLAGGRRLAVTVGLTESNWHYWMPASTFGGPSGFDSRTRQATVEARLSSAPAAVGGIDWMAGVFASRLSKDSPYLFEIPSYMRSATTADIEGSTAALFGEVGWRLADAWRLAAALRVEHDRRRMDWTSEQSGYFDGNGDGISETPYATTDRVNGLKTRDTVTLPRLSLEWRPDARQFGWLTLARGFKASGFNLYAYDPISAATPYAPEYGNHVELGWRLRGEERRWELGASVFYTRLRDQQVVVIGAGGASLVSNAGRSHSQGLELNAAVRPLANLSLALNAGWVQAEYDRYQTGAENFAGQSFPNAPRSSLGVAVNWQPAPGWDSGLSIRRLGSSTLYPDITVRQKAFTLVDAHLSHRFGRWTVGVYGRNLADAKYLSRALSDTAVVAGAPRTLGLRVGMDF